MIYTADYLFTAREAPVRNGYVECDDNGTVLSYGVYDPLKFSGKPVVRCRGFLVPGFANAHCHLELSYLEGMFRQGTGMDGFIKQINELRTAVVPEVRQKAIRDSLDSLVSQGVTCMGDISNCDESFAVKKEKADLIFTRTFLEVFGTEPEDAQQVLESALDLQREAASLGLQAAPTPHSCYTMSPLLNRLSAAKGLESGYISYHSQESREEEDMLRYGTGPLAEDYRGRGTTQLPVTGTGALEYFIDNLSGAMDMPVAGNVLLVHNVALDQRSIDVALGNLKNPYWVLCPLSNIFIHRALPPVQLMRKNGLKICLGTDSLSSNTVLSPVAELKCLQDNFPDVPLSEMIGWACLNGAEAIGCSEYMGSIEVGKTPGIVLISDVDVDNIKLTGTSRSTRLV